MANLVCGIFTRRDYSRTASDWTRQCCAGTAASSGADRRWGWACVFVISLSKGSWATAVPVALVFPLLLWVAVRCRPVFAAAAAFIVGFAIIWSTTFDMGHFGDASIPLADRILGAQTFVLFGALLTLVLDRKS